MKKRFERKMEMSLTPLVQFITHQIPRGLMVDEVIELRNSTARQMEIVEERQ